MSCADSWIDGLYESKNCHEIIFFGVADEEDISAYIYRLKIPEQYYKISKNFIPEKIDPILKPELIFRFVDDDIKKQFGGICFFQNSENPLVMKKHLGIFLRLLTFAHQEKRF